MSHPNEGSSTAPTQHGHGSDELSDIKDADGIAQRAREIAREGRQREDQRHDEYDDPDQGGEA